VPAGGGVPLLRAQFGQVLRILLVTAGLVLLIAAANLANLLLARADRGEVAVRAALGASSGRLMRLSMAEGVLLALAGVAVAVWLASLGTRALVSLAFPGAIVDYVPIDATPGSVVWLFALALAVVTGVLFSAGPAWAMARTPSRDALYGAGRSGGLQAFVPRRSLVVTQVALSFVLITGAGLLASTLGHLEGQALGFQPEGRMVVFVDPPGTLAGDRERLARLYRDMRDRLLAIPCVRDASYALYSPMQGDNWSSTISIAGRREDPASPFGSSWNRVGPRYFETVGTRLLDGRAFAESEITTGPRVAVVNDAFRRRFFEEESPIGQHVGIGGASHAGDYEIVGVVDDVRYNAQTRLPVRPMIFLPAFQSVEYADPAEVSVQARSMLLRTLVVNASVGRGALEAAIRRAIAEVDSEITIIRMPALADQVAASFRTERLLARLTSLYGLLALVLAAVGLYGVTAFGVAQRTREIGVRMALGADRGRVLRTIVRGPILQTAIGLALGVPLAMAAVRAMASQLYGVGNGAPAIFTAAAGVLLVTGGIAALMPALRAASIDPTRALRGD
jgi:predicted permease